MFTSILKIILGGNNYGSITVNGNKFELSGNSTVELVIDGKNMGSYSGDLKVDVQGDIVELKTTNGDVDVQGSVSEIKTTNGNVRVTSPEKIEGLNIKTTNGNVTIK